MPKTPVVHRSHEQNRAPECLQSILTGESSSVEKYLESTQSRKAVYQDKTCLLFSVRRTCYTTHDSHFALLNATVMSHLSAISA